MTPTFEIATPLGAPADEVWRFAVAPEGINYELGPWVRMTMPRGVSEDMTLDDVAPGERLGKSWIFLAGFIPVEYDDLCLAEVGPGMRFLERSTMASARSWEHQREVVSTGESACEITDRLTIDLRAPVRLLGGGWLAPRVIRLLFRHRHKRLRLRWGAA
jgi:ligand-binding SRPBCC domain-containing protein